MNSASQEPAIVDGDLAAITEAAPSGMVERVARALEPSAFETYARGYTQRNAHDTTAFLNAEKVVRRARRKARAAIEAMREPTEAVSEAAKPFRKGVGEEAQRLWRAMIDAALSEAE